MSKWKAHVDGAARGNPGPAGIGVSIEDGEGNVVKEVAEPLGRTTNNVAEYTALIRALEEARALRLRRSGRIHRQRTDGAPTHGKYKVKAEHLLPLYQRARLLLGQFATVSVTHVRRELNKRADALSNIGADKVTNEK